MEARIELDLASEIESVVRRVVREELEQRATDTPWLSAAQAGDYLALSEDAVRSAVQTRSAARASNANASASIRPT